MTATAQGENSTESHDPEKANQGPSSSASIDGEKQPQLSAESVDASEAGLSFCRTGHLGWSR